MTRKGISGILAMLILFAGLIGMFGTPVVAESIPPFIEEPQPPPGDLWMPYVPHPNLVDLELLTADQWVSVEVTLWLTGCVVSDWRTLEQDGNNFWVDTQIWKWMGPVIQIVIPESYIYDLGYLEAGNYTFTFKAWDNDVKSVSFTVPFVVENLPPIADFTYSSTFPYVGQTVTFDASDSSDSDGTIVSYEWDFGDGFTGTGALTTYTYESAGTFNVTLTVTDDLGATDTLQQEITVDPLPTLTITINKIKKGTTQTILLELVDDDYDGFITQDVDKRLRGIIRRTHKTTTFDFPGTYSATKGALNVTLQSRNDFTITLS